MALGWAFDIREYSEKWIRFHENRTPFRNKDLDRRIEGLDKYDGLDKYVRKVEIIVAFLRDQSNKLDFIMRICLRCNSEFDSIDYIKSKEDGEDTVFYCPNCNSVMFKRNANGRIIFENYFKHCLKNKKFWTDLCPPD